MTAETQPAGVSPVYTAAYDSIRKGAPGLSDATCKVIARSINMKVALIPAPPPQEPEGGALREVIARVGKFAEFWDQSDENHIAEPPEGCEAGMGGLSKDLHAILAALPSLAQADLQKVQNGDAQAQGERGGETLGELVSLSECPPGLFLWNGTLGFMSEYGAMEPVVMGKTWTVGKRADAYCADSGEYFWGGTSNHDDRAKLMVQPVDAASLLSAPPATGWRPIETAPRNGDEFQAWWGGAWMPRARFDPEYGSFQLWGRTDFNTEGWEVFEIDGYWQPQPAPPAHSEQEG